MPRMFWVKNNLVSRLRHNRKDRLHKSQVCHFPGLRMELLDEAMNSNIWYSNRNRSHYSDRLLYNALLHKHGWEYQGNE